MKKKQEPFRIQAINRHRMYIDGKGINTLVGLYGCPLKCKYCLNKEQLAKVKYQEISPEVLAEKVLIDYCYFKATGGGVTFGGGEPLLHSSQIKDFRNYLPEDIPIRVETSLNVATEHLVCVLGTVDTYIIDVKSLNEKVYMDYTGLNNQYVLKNLRVLCESNLQDKCKIRIPNIKGYTTEQDIDDTKASIKAMGFENLDIFDYVVR